MESPGLNDLNAGGWRTAGGDNDDTYMADGSYSESSVALTGAKEMATEQGKKRQRLGAQTDWIESGAMKRRRMRVGQTETSHVSVEPAAPCQLEDLPGPSLSYKAVINNTAHGLFRPDEKLQVVAGSPFTQHFSAGHVSTLSRVHLASLFTSDTMTTNTPEDDEAFDTMRREYVNLSSPPRMDEHENGVGPVQEVSVLITSSEKTGYMAEIPEVVPISSVGEVNEDRDDTLGSRNVSSPTGSLAHTNAHADNALNDAVPSSQDGEGAGVALKSSRAAKCNAALEQLDNAEDAPKLPIPVLSHPNESETVEDSVRSRSLIEIKQRLLQWPLDMSADVGQHLADATYDLQLRKVDRDAALFEESLYPDFQPTEREKKSCLDMMMLTPAAKSSLWYCLPSERLWLIDHLPTGHLQSFLSSLHSQLRHIDEFIFLDIIRDDGAAFSTIAYNSLETPSTSTLAKRWLVSVYGFLAQDRVSWAILSALTSDFKQPLQHAFSKFVKPVAAARTEMRAVENWAYTVALFCLSTCETIRSKSRRLVFPTCGSESNTPQKHTAAQVIQSLVDALNQCGYEQHSLNTQQRMLLAAIALHAFQIEENDSNKDMLMIERLAHALSIKELISNSGKVEDVNLCRTLMIAVGFSPIALLRNSKAQVGLKSGKLSTCKFFDAMVHQQMPRCENQLRVEADIWNYIVKLAVGGYDISSTTKTLDNLALEWLQFPEVLEAMKTITTPPRDPHLEVLQQRENLWNQRLQNNLAQGYRHMFTTTHIVSVTSEAYRMRGRRSEGWFTEGLLALQCAGALCHFKCGVPQSPSAVSYPHRLSPTPANTSHFAFTGKTSDRPDEDVSLDDTEIEMLHAVSRDAVSNPPSTQIWNATSFSDVYRVFNPKIYTLQNTNSGPYAAKTPSSSWTVLKSSSSPVPLSTSHTTSSGVRTTSSLLRLGHSTYAETPPPPYSANRSSTTPLESQSSRDVDDQQHSADLMSRNRSMPPRETLTQQPTSSGTDSSLLETHVVMPSMTTPPGEEQASAEPHSTAPTPCGTPTSEPTYARPNTDGQVAQDECWNLGIGVGDTRVEDTPEDFELSDLTPAPDSVSGSAAQSPSDADRALVVTEDKTIDGDDDEDWLQSGDQQVGDKEIGRGSQCENDEGEEDEEAQEDDGEGDLKAGEDDEEQDIRKAKGKAKKRTIRKSRREPLWPLDAKDAAPVYYLEDLPARPFLVPLMDTEENASKRALTWDIVTVQHTAVRQAGHELIREQYKCSLECYPGLESDFIKWSQISRLVESTNTAASRKTYKDSMRDFPQANSVRVFSYDEWAGMTDESQLDVFARHSVHLVGTPQPRAMPALSSLQDRRILGRYVCLESPRFVHDMQHYYGDDIDDRMFRANLHEFLDIIEEPANFEFGKRTLNCLDIPLTVPPIPPPSIQQGWQLHSLNAKSHTFKTSYPTYADSWALFGTARAISDVHIDAAGFATWIQIVRGAKLWYIMTGSPRPTPDGEFDIEAEHWEVVVLREGDTLLMRPCTPHFVVTVSDCIAVGGHFYCSSTYGATARAMAFENMYGASLTNAEQDTSAVILMKSLYFYISQQMAWIPRQDQSRSAAGRTAHIAPSELAWLAVLLLYVDLLPPEERHGSKPKGTVRGTKAFREDVEWTRALIVEMYKRGTEEQRTLLTSTQDYFHEFMQSLGKPMPQTRFLDHLVKRQQQ